MRFVIPTLALSLLAAQAITQAQAAPPLASDQKTTLTQRFEAANTTHDGHLTKQQAQAAHMQTVSRHFDAIDKDHKGYVTVDDISAYTAAQRAQRNATAKPPG
jgi:hypothetical protein